MIIRYRITFLYKRLNHEVQAANSMLQINVQRQALNEIKQFTIKKDPKLMEIPGP